MSVERVNSSTKKEAKLDLFNFDIIAVFGKSGTGKTTIATVLAQKTGATLLSSDVFRRKRYGRTQYREQHSQVAYEDMFKEGEKLMCVNSEQLIFDATFSKRKYREMLKQLAQRHGKNIAWVEIISQETVLNSNNIDGAEIQRNVDSYNDIPERVIIDNSSHPKPAGIIEDLL